MASEEKSSEENYDALYSRILMIGVADKIKLAISGNQAARSILVRDPNKMVAVAVVKSPEIQQAEIESIAKSRSVCEEVLRAIASRQEWMKSSRIRFSLASNPKTPVPIALKILPSLGMTELEALAAHQEIDPYVSMKARELLY
jgi:dihydroorotate dehydrogenase